MNVVVCWVVELHRTHLENICALLHSYRVVGFYVVHIVADKQCHCFGVVPTFFSTRAKQFVRVVKLASHDCFVFRNCVTNVFDKLS